ncbi:hypothetical protein J4456_01820 [Candidatus Pacearchaeota archaeon]|nr:hypothetical protein [Candidatus Pacearchaeota archaeon]
MKVRYLKIELDRNCTEEYFIAIPARRIIKRSINEYVLGNEYTHSSTLREDINIEEYKPHLYGDSKITQEKNGEYSQEEIDTLVATISEKSNLVHKANELESGINQTLNDLLGRLE